jgi:hypothetical protein
MQARRERAGFVRMTWARRGDTRNPLDILIEREERNPECRHCTWSLGKTELLGDWICAKDRVMRARCVEFTPLQRYIERSKAFSKRSR